jgi:uncharacterized RDD family membrane protein YckC
VINQKKIWGTATMYDRYIIRRIIAVLIDLTLALLFTSFLLFPFAKSLDSPIRINDGLFFLKSCNPGTAYTSPNKSFSLEGWNQIFICDQLTNGLFPSRNAVFYQETVSGSVKNFKSVSIPLNSKNEAIWAFPAEYVSMLLLVLLAAIFESSRLRATPGKLVVGLKVNADDFEQITFASAMIRNAIKYIYVIFAFVLMLAVYLRIYSPFGNFFQIGNPIVTFDPQSLFWFVGPMTVVGILNLIDWGSVLLPWSKAGRGFHDRWTGSYVFRD